jgi:hypothetical protein
MAALFALPTLLKLATDPLAWCGVAIVGALAFAGVQTMRLDHAKADQIDPATHKPWKGEEQRDGPLLAIANADLITCRSNEGVLSGSLDAQNAAVARLKAAGDARIASASAGVAKAQGLSVAADQKAVAILNHKAAGDACASADALILGSLK